VSAIDTSALESLEAIDQRLRDMGISLHLSEVKGPVMDRLARTHFLHDLSGRVFLSQFDAVQQLSKTGPAAIRPTPARAATAD
ncbi:sodium-independent anion transporter, partial [Escherichia coli]|nr:sodium-independent anion transporter [Escherichia coli]